jgi:DNA-binding NtrC family response regulator
MSAHLVLLLTQDPGLQISLSQTLAREETIILVAHNAGEAMQIVCTHGKELDFAVVDFDDGCRGMTLLSAMEICQPALPLIAIISNDAYHAAAVVYANGVNACLAKPIRAEDLEIVIHELAKPKLQLKAA